MLSRERSPQGEKIGIINGEHLNRDTANRCAAGQRQSFPLEVFVPQVNARMEESNKLACVWIRSRDVWAFVPIAVKTGEGEILKNSLASC